MVNRIVRYVAIKIHPTVEPNGVFGDPSTRLRIVIPCPEAGQARIPIINPTGKPKGLEAWVGVGGGRLNRRNGDGENRRRRGLVPLARFPVSPMLRFPDACLLSAPQPQYTNRETRFLREEINTAGQTTRGARAPARRLTPNGIK